MDFAGSHVALTSSSRAGISVSGDYGQSWQTVGPVGFYSGIASSVSGQYLVAAQLFDGASGSVYYSSDYGSSWTAAPSPVSQTGNWYNAAISGTGQYMMAVSEGSGVAISSDYGQSWSLLSGFNGCYDFASISFTGQYMTMINCASSGTATGAPSAWQSSDYGQTWKLVTFNGIGLNETITSFASASYQPQYEIVSTSAGVVYVSNSYGASWTKVSVSPSVEDDTILEDYRWPSVTTDYYGRNMLGFWTYGNAVYSTNASVAGAGPTMAPTAVPSYVVGSPTPEPSLAPTRVPSSGVGMPTANPSSVTGLSPSVMPTGNPTVLPGFPTAEPTSGLSLAPTSTGTPTVPGLSVAPTIVPTYVAGSPSPAPSVYPTLSPVFTSSPTQYPLASVTSAPSVSPILYEVRLRCFMNIFSETITVQQSQSIGARIAIIESIWDVIEFIPIENIRLLNLSSLDISVGAFVPSNTLRKLSIPEVAALPSTVLFVTWEGRYTNQDIENLNATNSAALLQGLFAAAVDDGRFGSLLAAKYEPFAGSSVNYTSFERPKIFVTDAAPTFAPTTPVGAQRNSVLTGSSFAAIVVGVLLSTCCLCCCLFFLCGFVAKEREKKEKEEEEEEEKKRRSDTTSGHETERESLFGASVSSADASKYGIAYPVGTSRPRDSAGNEITPAAAAAVASAEAMAMAAAASPREPDDSPSVSSLIGKQKWKDIDSSPKSDYVSKPSPVKDKFFGPQVQARNSPLYKSPGRSLSRIGRMQACNSPTRGTTNNNWSASPVRSSPFSSPLFPKPLFSGWASKKQATSPAPELNIPLPKNEPGNDADTPAMSQSAGDLPVAVPFGGPSEHTAESASSHRPSAADINVQASTPLFDIDDDDIPSSGPNQSRDPTAGYEPDFSSDVDMIPQPRPPVYSGSRSGIPQPVRPQHARAPPVPPLPLPRVPVDPNELPLPPTNNTSSRDTAPASGPHGDANDAIPDPRLPVLTARSSVDSATEESGRDEADNLSGAGARPVRKKPPLRGSDQSSSDTDASAIAARKAARAEAHAKHCKACASQIAAGAAPLDHAHTHDHAAQGDGSSDTYSAASRSPLEQKRWRI
jgi:hypothetical protein